MRVWMVAWRLAALWLGLIAVASVPQARGAGGEVIVERLEVLDEPDPSGYVSGELRSGDRVSIRGSEVRGWLAIAPPRNAFHWVDGSSIRVGPDGSGEVSGLRASVRSGCPGAKMPGPPRTPLAKGTVVRLVDRPDLVTGKGRSRITWRAIEPPVGEVRYVRSESVRLDPPPAASSRPTGVDDQVERVQFRKTGDPAQRFEDALRRSRARDQEVARSRQELADARTSTERRYDARGLLQASSRKVDGQKVHALIGPEGVPIAYLSIPPGIPASRLTARKVGVRGEVHYNESLGATLITVHDLDSLDKPR